MAASAQLNVLISGGFSLKSDQPHNHRRAIARPLGVCCSGGDTLIVIVLLTLMFVALEVFLSGDESLSALEPTESAKDSGHYHDGP
jgi:hypothetical protein